MRPMLMSTARKILGDETEAEDLVQDALLRLWQLRDEPIRNVEAMAKVVMRHLCYDAVRRRHEQIPIEEVDMMDASPSEGLDDEGGADDGTRQTVAHHATNSVEAPT